MLVTLSGISVWSLKAGRNFPLLGNGVQTPNQGCHEKIQIPIEKEIFRQELINDTFKSCYNFTQKPVH